MDPNVIGTEHYEIARGVQKILQDYKSLQDIIAILGMDELSEEDKFRSQEPERLRDSCLSLSRSLRSSPATLASLSPLPRLFLGSRRSWLESTTICQRLLSTWLAMLTKLLPRLTAWQLREENRLCSIYRSIPSWPKNIRLAYYLVLNLSIQNWCIRLLDK